jgi:cell division protein FtsZ
VDSFLRNAMNQDGYSQNNNRSFESPSNQGFRGDNPKLMNSAPKRNAVDDELEQLLSQQKAKIKVIGVGGGGNNTINRISEVGIVGSETVAINTDAQDLLYTTADKKILIGKETTRGLGAGSMPKVGEEAAREDENAIKQAIIWC